MRKSKPNATKVSTIPDSALEASARCLLPAIRLYFESDEGQREFDEWKAGQGLREEQKLQQEELGQLEQAQQLQQMPQLEQESHPRQQQPRQSIESLPSREMESSDSLRLAG